jgi:hypothetical protein
MSTTPHALASIDSALLASVSGGCHKGCPPPAPPAPAPQTTQIVNVPQAPAPQAAPPMPPPAPSVQTSVSINGQPA